MEEIACETSSDCGGLSCIDQVCRDPFAPVQHEHDGPHTTLGHRMMFGTGEGYGLLIALLDVGAAAVEPLLLFEANTHSGPPQTGFGISCFVTVGLTGSITHFAHGRVVPGIVSMFAWTTGAALTFSIAGLSGERGFTFDEGIAWGTGLVVGAAATATLTLLDVWMARPMPTRAHTSSFVIAPSIVPLRDGALAALGGRF